MATTAEFNSPSLCVTGFLAVAALERYQSVWEELIDRWFDAERFARVNDELDDLRKLVAEMPQLSADLMEVVMRHAQVLRALIRPSTPKPRSAEIAALRQKHRTAIEAIRAKCLRLLEPT
jgi:hypothetical protein